MGMAQPPSGGTRGPSGIPRATPGGRPKTSRPDAAVALRASAWFCQLPQALQQALLEDGAWRQLAAGEALFARGDAFDGLYCVAGGTMQVDAAGESGKAALLGLLEAGAWFGEICLFDGLPRTHDARAVHAALLWHIPRASLERRLAQHPSWWREFGLLLAAKTRMVFDFVEEMQLLPPAARIARRLAAIARGYGNPPSTEGETPAHPRAVQTVRIPQEQLAQMLGLSRQTVNQALRELESRGLLRLRYGSVDLLDLVALETLN
ncbi:Crp/Fnr family transcriptional regulator [Cupriavidus sp. WKF15]|uniref:Crp/Fnr family transcriptional regulator n=1 Tax=Cupriavidus sp. WKF15 TaxID=3032282 RepID=UPI0023E1F5A2|nr:Crp/Fnr family transcriptional regulator [Cupriavidus sp. WKF15]WER48283.1 Crp/Fnr family transcriptional regulator [Cupriavidus sp. WKF15]